MDGCGMCHMISYSLDHMPMLFMSANATVYMWRATSTGWPVGVPDWVTLPIAATAMDYDSHSRTLYWISANDGVSPTFLLPW